MPNYREHTADLSGFSELTDKCQMNFGLSKSLVSWGKDGGQAILMTEQSSKKSIFLLEYIIHFLTVNLRNLNWSIEKSLWGLKKLHHLVTEKKLQKGGKHSERYEQDKHTCWLNSQIQALRNVLQRGKFIQKFKKEF